MAWTREKWIAMATERWEGKYNYSKVVWNGVKNKIIIICPEHGEIDMLPNDHVAKRKGNTGCRHCGSQNKNKDRKVTWEQFLQRANKKFKSKYTYDASSWTEFTAEVKYTCPIHGLKSQQGHVHLGTRENNMGCDECGREHANESMRLDFDNFINRSIEKHEGLYSYLYVTYMGSHNPTAIFCKEHGIFLQEAKSHMEGAGCPTCWGHENMGREEFIRRSIEVHEGKYSYDNLVYVNSNTYVIITCPIHGDFTQSPINHIHAKSGCPDCAYAFKGLDSIPSYEKKPEWANSDCELYITFILNQPDWVKIGISNRSEKRDPLYTNLKTTAATRAECWCVEQFLLMETAQHEVKDLPEEFQEWRGRHELRYRRGCDYDQLVQEGKKQIAQVKEMGWQKYAEVKLIPKMGAGWRGRG